MRKNKIVLKTNKKDFDEGLLLKIVPERMSQKNFSAHCSSRLVQPLSWKNVLKSHPKLCFFQKKIISAFGSSKQVQPSSLKTFLKRQKLP